ncbi:AAA family ATPase [Lentimicrobium sp. S6]|uniref:AAA family ATPase n=1 Tax=Lentimicrobium sp. S6 TaxID=2735872 RepID=UPI00155214E9|nr:AAA family ATPase [Lentimicrobium sp. S6]NPD47412.1 AAA family ATPase [Lentimicrobium sp. S6]
MTPIYVSTEDDDYAISFLLNKANIDRRLPNESFQDLTFIFDTHELVEKLDQQLKVSKVDLIVIDAFTDIYGKSMNDTNQVRTFLNEYSQLAQRHKCLIIFLHHTGKRTEELAPSKHNLLGSQGFEAKMRLVIELRNDLIYSDKKHLCIVKGNYLPNEYKTESFVMLFDENLQFTMTEERVPYNNLKPGSNIVEKEAVKKLKDEGKTQTEIARELSISQAKVSRILKD